MDESIAGSRSRKLTSSEISALDILLAENTPQLHSSSAPWLFGTPVILVMLLCAAAYLDITRSPLLLAITSLFLFAGFAVMWVISTRLETSLRRTVYLVQESRMELN